MDNLREILKLFAAHQFDEALAEIDRSLAQCPDCPSLLVSRGVVIQLLNHRKGPALSEAERSFLRALEVAPDNISAIEELAHYYDAVADDSEKAKLFAREYLNRVEPVIEEMRALLRE
ncbi:MAG: hypothetical protein ACHQJX_10905 [Candidatus Acidiferrales bacterium]